MFKYYNMRKFNVYPIQNAKFKCKCIFGIFRSTHKISCQKNEIDEML